MAASDRRMRVAIEMKADDDLHLALQGLDYGFASDGIICKIRIVLPGCASFSGMGIWGGAVIGGDTETLSGCACVRHPSGN
jgi:hypothetical protein